MALRLGLRTLGGLWERADKEFAQPRSVMFCHASQILRCTQDDKAGFGRESSKSAICITKTSQFIETCKMTVRCKASMIQLTPIKRNIR